MNKQGTDAHKAKQEYLSRKSNISQYGIYVNKDTGQLGLFEKVQATLLDTLTILSNNQI